VSDGEGLNSKVVVNQQYITGPTIVYANRSYNLLGKFTMTGTTVTITLSDGELGTWVSAGSVLLARA
jgi:hypothetical protein